MNERRQRSRVRPRAAAARPGWRNVQEGLAWRFAAVASRSSSGNTAPDDGGTAGRGPDPGPEIHPGWTGRPRATETPARRPDHPREKPGDETSLRWRPECAGRIVSRRPRQFRRPGAGGRTCRSPAARHAGGRSTTRQPARASASSPAREAGAPTHRRRSVRERPVVCGPWPRARTAPSPFRLRRRTPDPRRPRVETHAAMRNRTRRSSRSGFRRRAPSGSASVPA